MAPHVRSSQPQRIVGNVGAKPTMHAYYLSLPPTASRRFLVHQSPVATHGTSRCGLLWLITAPSGHEATSQGPGVWHYLSPSSRHVASITVCSLIVFAGRRVHLNSFDLDFSPGTCRASAIMRQHFCTCTSADLAHLWTTLPYLVPLM